MFLVRLVMLHPDMQGEVEMEFNSDYGTDHAVIKMIEERTRGLILLLDIERVGRA